MEPVMIVLTPDGKLVRAGDPKLPKPKELADYVRSGYEIKTITIDEFRATKWVWHWEK